MTARDSETLSCLARPRSGTLKYEPVYADWQIEVAIEISIINKNVMAFRRPIGLKHVEAK